ncbi:MAG: sn-glycerol-3-phosphate ABC transporter ATP-binding protein UgpC [Sedimentisphaerales bacterium]
MAQVLLKDIKKIYDNGFVAVRDINLSVNDKEFIVIVGPSGCGKTTVLRMIAGLEEITEGTVVISDRVVNDVPPKDRNIAMVFQNYALYPHMTVFQNMAFSLKLRKYPKAEIKKRVEEAAEILGIADQLSKKPKALSGGQRQRVALGRAIVRNPAAFLFDEPLSNLDAKLRVTTRAELKALHRRLKTTSIYVTHDQAEAMTLGDRICVMYNGVIQQVAPPMEVYDKPANRFVAGFLGTPPMNFFEGRLQLKDNKISFVLSDGTAVGLKAANSFKPYIDKEMVLGVRPEHLTVEQLAGQSDNGIRSTVNVVEPLGDRKDVYLTSSSGLKFIANLDPHTAVDVDQRVTMYVDISKAHIFEPGETGKNVTLAG